MKVEVVLTEADIAQEFAEAIEARDLPEKFFFWFPRSAGTLRTLRRTLGDLEGAGCQRGCAGQELPPAHSGDQLRRRRRRPRPHGDERPQERGLRVFLFPGGCRR